MFKSGFYPLDTLENNYPFSKEISLCKYYGLYLKQ